MNTELVEACNALVRAKNIDRDILVGILEDIFTSMVKKEYGEDASLQVVVNIERGEIEIFLEKKVVETVVNPVQEISLPQVQKLSEDELNIGDDYVEIINFVKVLGRRAIRMAFQELVRRIKDLEKDSIFNEYANLVGEVIVGEVYHQRGGDVYILHNKNELMLPRTEQISREKYKKGSSIRVIVKEVQRNNGIPRVIVSRSAPEFLAKLFTMEIPEIFDGVIEIKSVAREPGERAKIAVISNDDRIDPVGACVGMKGVRIHAIVRELSNENIDVVQFSDDEETFIARSLAPAKIKSISLNKHSRTANVFIDNDQASLAIGKSGQNIRLATKLTNYEINLVRDALDEVYDMDLTDLRDELGEDALTLLTENGFTTARDVLDAKRMTLLAIDGLDDDIIDQIREVIQDELDSAEVDEEVVTPVVEDENIQQAIQNLSTEEIELLKAFEKGKE
ncbi:MAG: transcription termination factor NusA [Bacteroidota bacterium]